MYQFSLSAFLLLQTKVDSNTFCTKTFDLPDATFLDKAEHTCFDALQQGLKITRTRPWDLYMYKFNPPCSRRLIIKLKKAIKYYLVWAMHLVKPMLTFLVAGPMWLCISSHKWVSFWFLLYNQQQLPRTRQIQRTVQPHWGSTTHCS